MNVHDLIVIFYCFSVKRNPVHVCGGWSMMFYGRGRWMDLPYVYYCNFYGDFLCFPCICFGSMLFRNPRLLVLNPKDSRIQILVQ